MHDAQLLGFHELAATFGISKQSTRKRIRRPDFPHPVAHLRCGPVWVTTDIEIYLERRHRR
jgi:hypothetical protein